MQMGKFPSLACRTSEKNQVKSHSIWSEKMIHPLLKRHLEAARKEIEHNMKGLQEALEIIEKTLGEPKPLPEPKGKPDLMEMAKEWQRKPLKTLITFRIIMVVGNRRQRK